MAIRRWQSLVESHLPEIDSGGILAGGPKGVGFFDGVAWYRKGEMGVFGDGKGSSCDNACLYRKWEEGVMHALTGELWGMANFQRLIPGGVLGNGKGWKRKGSDYRDAHTIISIVVLDDFPL